MNRRRSTLLACLFVVATLPLAFSECRSVRDFGAAGDGRHDDRAAIQAALDNAGCVRFPAGTYRIASYDEHVVHDGNYALQLRSGNDLEGDRGARIMLGAGFVPSSPALRGANLFHSESEANVTVRGLEIDLNGANNLVPAGRVLTGYAFFFQDTTHVLLERLLIHHSSGRNMVVVHGGSDVQLVDNTFRVGGTALPGNHQDDFSFVYLKCEYCSAIHNTLTNEHEPETYAGGIELHSSHGVARDNFIEYAWPGVYLASEDKDSGITDLTVSGNTFSNCLTGVIVLARWQPITNARIEGNIFSTIQFAKHPKEPSYAIQQWRPKESGVWSTAPALVGATIAGNQFTDRDGETEDGRTFFLQLSSAQNVDIAGNNIGPISGIPFFFQAAPSGLHDIRIHDNDIHDYGQNRGPNYHIAFFFDLGRPEKPLADERVESTGVHINNNRISLTRSTGREIVFFGDWAGGGLRNLDFRGNSIRNVPRLGAGNRKDDLENATRP